jgi:hypothetical protein
VPDIFDGWQGFLTLGAVRNSQPSYPTISPTEYYIMILDIDQVSSDGSLIDATLASWYPYQGGPQWPITGYFDDTSGSISFTLSAIFETWTFDGYVCQFDADFSPRQANLAGTYERFTHFPGSASSYLPSLGSPPSFETFYGSWYAYGDNGPLPLT